MERDKLKINFIVVKIKNYGMFITDNVEGSSYFSSKIPDLFFDGEKLQSTFKKGWYILPTIPTEVKVKGKPYHTNKRYELKSGFPVSELTPSVIDYEDWDSDSEISGLYSYNHDVIEGTLETVDFDIEIID